MKQLRDRRGVIVSVLYYYVNFYLTGFYYHNHQQNHRNYFSDFRFLINCSVFDCLCMS